MGDLNDILEPPSQTIVVCIPVRDKDFSLVGNCLESIKRNMENCKACWNFIVTDLGSEDPYSRSLKSQITAIDDFLYYKRIDYTGDWNKPIAMNAVLKDLSSKWFAVLDADYILEENFLRKVEVEMEHGVFIQCRGYDMEMDDLAVLLGRGENGYLGTYGDMVDAIHEFNWDPRPKADYGGFQLIPTEVTQDVNGYDENFKLYGGMHHEMKERLVNYGLRMKRLHGVAVMLHQPHKHWIEEESEDRQKVIEKERDRHRAIISRLKKTDRTQAPVGLEEGYHAGE